MTSNAVTRDNPVNKKSRKKTDRPRVKDADATRENILNEALREFSQNGLSGARVDKIADNTRTSKRMIYYYFKSKNGLFLAVLKECYRRLRELEMEFDLEGLPPMVALRKLVEVTVDYQARHSDLIRVVMTENIQNGEYIRQLTDLKPANRRVNELIERLCKRGVDEGVFRSDFDPIDLHMNISALSFFNVSNRHTDGYIFDRDF